MTSTGKVGVIRAAFPRFEIREGGKEEAWIAQANGENNIWRVWIWNRIDQAAAVGAQELYEWRWRTLIGMSAGLLAMSAFIAAAIFVHPAFGWGAPLAFWAAFVLIPQLHFFQRRKELMSHEIEVQVAGLFYGSNVVYRRLAEIGSPSAGGMMGYDWLKRMTATEIEQAMIARSKGALRWVHRNWDFIGMIRRSAA